MESKVLSKRQSALWDMDDKLVDCKNAITQIKKDCDDDYIQRWNLDLLEATISICLTHLDLIKEVNTKNLHDALKKERQG